MGIPRAGPGLEGPQGFLAALGVWGFHKKGKWSLLLPAPPPPSTARPSQGLQSQSEATSIEPRESCFWWHCNPQPQSYQVSKDLLKTSKTPFLKLWGTHTVLVKFFISNLKETIETAVCTKATEGDDFIIFETRSSIGSGFNKQKPFRNIFPNN